MARKEADQDQAKDRGDDVVDEHRDLEVERFLAVRVDLGRFVTLGHPNEEGPEKVAGEMKQNAEQGTGVTKRVPGADIGGDGALTGSGGDAEVSMALDGWPVVCLRFGFKNRALLLQDFQKS